MSTSDEQLQTAMEAHRRGSLDAAESGYQMLLSQDPNHANALYLMGVLSIQKCQYPQAVVWLRQAAALAGHMALVQVHLAKALLLSGNATEAASVFELTARLDPGSIEARFQSLFLHRFPEASSWERSYQASVDTLRGGSFLEYPREVTIETLSKCNATCTFCPYTTLARKGARMSDALITKIVNDLTQIPQNHQFFISLFKVNEPFLDARLFEILEECRQRLPNTRVRLFSNGSVMTTAILERLTQTTNLEQLWFSLNEHRSEEYAQVVGLPFDRTFDNLRLIHDNLDRFSFPVVLSRVTDNTPMDQAFADWAGAQFPRFRCVMIHRGEWLDQVAVHRRTAIPPIGCGRWFELSITATGEVAHCCMDGRCEHPIGNVTQQTVLDVYNAPAYRKLREGVVSRQDVHPCNRCTYC